MSQCAIAGVTMQPMGILARSGLRSAMRCGVPRAGASASSTIPQPRSLASYTGLRTDSLGLPKRSQQVAPHRIHSGVRAFSVKAAAEEYDYDLFCIGAGSGGVRATRMSTSYGAKVAVCEMPFATVTTETLGGVGGTCVIRGCVPKKLLVYASHYAEDFKDCQKFGWTIPEAPVFNWKTLITNKNDELDRLTGIYGKILGNANVEVMTGRGSIVDKHTVDVDGKRFTAKNILIATGGRAFVPDLPGKELVITSDEALDLPDLPKKIVIVGSGYIALEFACIFNQMGSEVHVVYRQDLPLRGFDTEVREFLAEQLKQKGIHMHPGTTPTAVEKTADGLQLVHSGGVIEAEQVMFATGRKPNVKHLGLEAVGVEMHASGAIKVDKFSQTTVDNIWAIGDVTDRINLTPVALMEGMALSKTLFGGVQTAPDHTNVACAVFTQPQIGTVGLTEDEAKEQCGDIDVYTSSFRPMKNTISGNEGKMFMKMIVDVATDKVVGVHIVGGDAAEILQGVAVAVKMGATKAQFDDCIGIHPTAAEELVTMRSVTREIRKTK
mmetsp:Transcript_33708/g.56613  ORF Transcript_33708/g.56613 Transcript_33708/m.56613 type:complete len:551 (-) Transcript_33708:486-2138(-)|eukprot:CAMPEP_0198198782 /NCGR_PEP_ID=MMETSP1445-20131203/2171_1 /TAXON_ID=36898 /ORGANISM="Pyramimonas sp., Strain CCMP2087" /LENGTH=550 /DNA_ID=CAMNT_0043868421 /DNA_START=125 /DNA_END=1777 /DNA_ORIENTATION=+